RASGHDVKHLVRCICNSQAYQRSSRALPDNENDRELFSHMAVKPFTPEVFYDSLVVVTGASRGRPATRAKKTGGQRKEPAPVAKGRGVGSRDEFIGHFRTLGDSADAGEFTHGIPQFLRRMNAPEFNAGAPLVEQLRATDASKERAVESLYLATL